MRIVRVLHEKKPHWGILESEKICLLKEPPFKAVRRSRNYIPIPKACLLAPSLPSKIIFVGLNYRNHARELGMKVPKEPVIFLKPTTTLLAPGADIVFPPQVRRLDYEAELAVVIKCRAKNVSEDRVQEYILGYTCCNDVTARDLQKKDGQWTRAKSFDTFCPLGPWIETNLNPADLTICSYLNNKLRQKSSTRNLIFSVPRLVSFISRVMTLLPGDVISTGTPPGVGSMKPHDRIDVAIEGIGHLRNCVVKF
ncbi:MAG: fumarylacetoacetate hydrolase family protein [Candidatus Omnitrophica bacterium]|nr:fumarylacetoacetate hydrolase family protein [Candidatus Omnitrophota bacterium]MBU4479320.1 fumarylacetoacetate hydrolase family protein [Candidatus Omnitrophota bacterium]MCG2704240.1 fumarylacetoacetate hydrolase family protein [Candidatus Omnitrophota bacterium]